MPDQQPLTDRVKKTIGPNMLFGLQDAELDGEGGQQRIREWVDWIAEAVTPLVADEVHAEVEKIRAAVTEGKGIGRPLTASDVMVAHEVTRKALARALAAGLHLNWPQLVDEAQRAHEANKAWKADVDRVRALHYRDGESCAVCTEDFGRLSAPWPCPTIQAIDTPARQENAADPRQPAYDAVFAYIHAQPRDFLPTTVVDRNALIWRAVHTALDAMGVPRKEGA